MNTAV
jgi:hypothetical protein